MRKNTKNAKHSNVTIAKVRAPLALAVSAVVGFNRRAEGAAEDMDMWGAPGECWGLMAPALELDLTVDLAELGWSRREYNEALHETISGKSIHRLNLMVDADPDTTERERAFERVRAMRGW